MTIDTFHLIIQGMVRFFVPVHEKSSLPFAFFLIIRKRQGGCQAAIHDPMESLRREFRYVGGQEKEVFPFPRFAGT